MPPVPFALGRLLREGPAPAAPRLPVADARRAVTLVLGPGHRTPRDAGLPVELLAALSLEGVTLTTLTDDEVEELLDRPPTPRAEATDGGALRIAAASDEDADAGPPGPLAADVLLAAGWTAAPAVLTVPGARARAVLVTADAPPLGHLGWTEGVLTLGPQWLGGGLPPGADAAYVPLPVHRSEDLVLVHGEEPFGLLAAAELHRRRPDDLSFAVSGVRADLELPFPFRGWRPAALAMLACGQPVVAPDDPAARAALGTDTAVLAADPMAAADAAERLIADWHERGERVRAGMEHVADGWSATASALAGALRAL